MSRLKFLCIFVLLVSISCQRAEHKNSSLDSSQDDPNLGFGQAEELKEVYYRFPAPDEMLAFVEKENFYYKSEILLPAENSGQYLETKWQALNLGVYIADLAYLTIFEQHQESVQYFEAVYNLSDKLRISAAFKPSMFIRAQNNLKNADSLKVIADESMTSITNYLMKNDKELTFAMISLGGFVEALYIAFQLSDEFDQSNQIVQRISDQKMVMENLLQYANRFSDDKGIQDAIKILEPIQEVYAELNEEVVETQVTKDEEGRLVVSGGSRLMITEEQYNMLKEATNKARKKITQN